MYFQIFSIEMMILVSCIFFENDDEILMSQGRIWKSESYANDI